MKTPMRILFSAVPVAGHVLPLTPMAAAAAADGHEVAILTSGGLKELLAPFEVLAAGPSMAVNAAETVKRVGRRWAGVGPEAAEMFAGTRVDLTFDDALVRAEEFGPDLLVCDALDFVGPTIAATLKVPWAAHGISGGLPPFFTQALDERWAAQLEQRGLSEPSRLAYVDPYPESLHGDGVPLAKDRVPVRITPYDRSDAGYQSPEFERPAPRVLITLGTTFQDHDMEREFVRSVAEAGFNVLVTGSADEDAAEAPNVRHVGFVPLARILPDADLVVSAGGTGTVLSALACGLPMVIRPVAADHPVNAARAEQLGAARVITDPADAGAVAQEVLGEPAFREAARTVQEQNRTLPSPAQVLRSLVARGPGLGQPA
jgi:UDP:flavonoid glycosyltransferase YjiC (YdhE family)